MIARLLLPLLLFIHTAAHADVIAPGDYRGGGLTLANGDILSGTYTNVSSFTVPAGVTVVVGATASGPNLTVYAATVSISGILDGTGRGQPGGSGGQVPSGAAQNGTGGGPSGIGGGTGAAATKGGGGGGAGGAGGVGAGDSGGGVGAAGGAAYGSTGTVTSPISSDDLFQGSGGGGGGANASIGGGSGASGGAAVYIEASSVTITGSILVDGSTAAAVTAPGGTTVHEGGGGGGGGGTVLIRVLNVLTLANGSVLSAKGGGGGNVSSLSANVLKAPGGGGGGGRIKLFYRSAAMGTVALSTAAGVAGSVGGGGFSGSVDASTPPAAGAAGSVSFGVVASSPTLFAVSAVYPSSISWTWSAPPSFGDAPAATQLYRVFPATVTAPFPAPQTTASVSLGATEQALTPNTTYTRFITAYSDWGDSYPSNAVSTHTLAAEPSAPAFSALAAASLTFGWSGGANPSYTTYELNASTSSSFAAAVSTTFAASVSSSPASLAPNTSYYFRVRAVNLDGVPTAYLATQTTATLAAAPSSPAAGPIHITSGVFTWSGGANPGDTLYTAQVSSDNFFTLTDSSNTLATSATFFSLSPGTQYFLRVRAVNRSGTPSAFSSVISTTAGNLADTTAPAAPGAPVADRAFSYDGTALFAWAPASSPVGILDYNLIVGSLPGGSDLFIGNVAGSTYAAAGMATGKSYYAQVRARSNAGVYSLFSPVSAALPVFIPAQNAPIAKPFTWPSPFNPAQGDAQIGFFLEEAADVTLKIYTLQGKLVRSDSRSFAAGNQIMTWNGNSDAGLRAAPGGYVAVIEKRYGSRTSTQKLKIAVLY